MSFATHQCETVQCPIEFMLSLIATKWSIPILRELFLGDRRTHEFLEALPGISTKTLTIRLRELEAHGLVKRTVYPEIPPHVEYALTEKGRAIETVMTTLHQVGSQWLEQDPCNCPMVPGGEEDGL